MRKFLSFLSGVLVGAITGAVIALLFAPSSGEELMADVQGRASTLRDEVRGAAQARRAELEKHLAELRKPHTAAG
jgi:gas vesicle protein